MDSDVQEILRQLEPHAPTWVSTVRAEIARLTAERDRLRAAALLAHEEMRNTVAPRNSFTDALDALDAALASDAE